MIDITRQPWMTSPEAEKIMDFLNNGEGEARFIGGCVRNAILGQEVKDIDIATTHRPEVVTKLLEAEDVKVVPTGIEHGTVTAVVNGTPFEITTLRKDVACDGRHAEVEYTDAWEEDVKRRDFTINTLALDREGNLYDYVGGEKDLQKGMVRFVGDAIVRINEDFLRILRMFRFHAYYGNGKIISKQLEACQRTAAGLKGLSGERIQAEMLKILAAPDPVYVLEEMNQHGVLTSVMPEGVTFPLKLGSLQALTYIEQTYGLYRGDNAIVRLACVLGLNSISESLIKLLAESWRLSNRDNHQLSLLTSPFHLLADMGEAAQKRTIRALGKADFLCRLLVDWAVLLHQHREEQRSEEDLNLRFSKMAGLVNRWDIPDFPISGNDIVQMGVPEGEEIGVLLKMAESYWEGNDYKPNKQELLRVIEEN